MKFVGQTSTASRPATKLASLDSERLTATMHFTSRDSVGRGTLCLTALHRM